jgi:uncharacterized protein YjbI with pentapeptide repeats
MMPAGTQFDDRAPVSVKIADELVQTPVEHDGVQVELTSTSRTVGYNTFLTTQVRSRTGDGRWKTTTLDNGKAWRKPRGLPSGRGARPAGVTAGPEGFVATVNQQFWDSTLSYRAALAGQIWSSPDGHAWTRSDPRSILGERVSYVLEAPVVGPDGQYFVAATVGPLDLDGPSKIVVLRSTDGRTWHQAATLDTRWTLDGQGISATQDGLLLRGSEFACDSTSFFQADFSVAAQPRLWAGDPSGSHWKELDATAGGLLVPPNPVPSKASACPSDLAARSEHYNVPGTLYDLIPGTLVAVDGDGTHVGVSHDSLDWNVAELPGAAVEGDSLRGVRAVRPVPQPDGSLVLLSLEMRRDDGQPLLGGYQVLAWQTKDDGVSWQMLPATRPFELRGSYQQLRSLPDGRVLLIDDDSTSTSHARALVGTAGPLIPWDSCIPAAGADCRYVTLTGVDVAGADLSGIDLAAATVTGGDWTGVTLKGARLVDATFDTPLGGADLADADASSAHFSDQLSGVTLQDTVLSNVFVPVGLLMGAAREANLRNARVGAPAVQPVGLDLAGLDLRDVFFDAGADPLGDLTNMDFAGVKLDGASFWHIDLTGAKLGKAKFKRLTFYGPDTICPDGKPATEGVYDQTACRMKPARS